MQSLRREGEERMKVVKVVQVTPEMMATMVKNRQFKGFKPATLIITDAG